MGEFTNKNLIVLVILVISALHSVDYFSRTSTDETALVHRTDKVIAADLDHHQSVYPYAYLPNSTAANYTWIGNQWFPTQEQSMDDPMFTPSEILRVFQTENTLWFGESTCRQDYHTMYQMLNNKNPNTKKVLQKYINKGKTGFGDPPLYHPPFYCPARTVPTVEGMLFRDLGQVAGTDRKCEAKPKGDDKNITITDWSGFSLDNQTGKFDYMYGKCLQHVITHLSTYRNLVEHEYSVLILSLGIWEIEKGKACHKIREETMGENVTTMMENLVQVLDFLHELSGPSLFVVWKIHGHDARHKIGGYKSNMGDALAQATRDWFLWNEPKYMDLADFRLAIADRTRGENRIGGDLPPHWGLDARLMSIDLLSRNVYRKQKRDFQE